MNRTTDFRLHKNATVEPAPRVVVIRRKPNNVLDVSSKELRGRYVRAFPTTGADVMFLQMLQHGVDKFAPEDGDGVIVDAEVLRLGAQEYAANR